MLSRKPKVVVTNCGMPVTALHVNHVLVAPFGPCALFVEIDFGGKYRPVYDSTCHGPRRHVSLVFGVFEEYGINGIVDVDFLVPKEFDCCVTTGEVSKGAWRGYFVRNTTFDGFYASPMMLWDSLKGDEPKKKR